MTDPAFGFRKSINLSSNLSKGMFNCGKVVHLNLQELKTPPFDRLEDEDDALAADANVFLPDLVQNLLSNME